jgi:hypothetical protein
MSEATCGITRAATGWRPWLPDVASLIRATGPRRRYPAACTKSREGRASFLIAPAAMTARFSA